MVFTLPLTEPQPGKFVENLRILPCEPGTHSPCNLQAAPCPYFFGNSSINRVTSVVQPV